MSERRRFSMSGRAWVAVTVLVALVLVFAPRGTPPSGAGGCAYLEVEAETLARESALLADALDSFAELIEGGARSDDARLVGRFAVEFVEVAETHERRAARVERQVARVCGS